MILDVVLIILLLVNAIYGYKKGCIKVVSRLVSVIIAFALAYMLAKTVGTYIWNNTAVGEKIETSITGVIQNYEEDKVDTENSEINKIIENGIESGKSQLILKISEYAATGIGFVITFVVARVALLIVVLLLEGIFELPVLKTFNKLGGVIVAIIIFVIEISVLLAIINFMSSFEFMKSVVTVINNSVITSALYEHNIITNVILNKII